MECTALEEDGVLRYYEVAPDLWFPEVVEVYGPAPGIEMDETSRNLMHAQYKARARFHMIPSGMSYAMTGISVFVETEENFYSDARLSIGTEIYRSLRLSELQGWIENGAGLRESEVPERAETWSLLADNYRDTVADNPELAETARVYATGSLSGRRPQRAVSESLGVSIATAGRRVRSAMLAGYLTQVIVFEAGDTKAERAEKKAALEQFRSTWKEPGRGEH